MNQSCYWYWFTNVRGLGRTVQHKMLEYFGTPEEIFYADIDVIAPFFKRKDTLQAFQESKNEICIEKGYQAVLDRGIRFLHLDSEEYPQHLHVIPDKPLGLYLKGSLPVETKKSIAIIGARECTHYGREMARFFGKELARAGIQVISGLARGIDGMAHVGALEGEGYTMGILGCGIDVVYPEENYELFIQMEQKGGILSESGLGQVPYAGLFPQRNRLIAGLADGILVIEAMEKSGTFITVDQGLEQGKEIFALPGRNIDYKSRGCNNLIKMGAHLVTEVSDILEVLHSDNLNTMRISDITDVEKFVYKNKLAPNEKIVYSCLLVEPQYLDEIIEKARIAPQEVCMALNFLVMKGGAVETSRNYYALRL